MCHLGFAKQAAEDRQLTTGTDGTVPATVNFVAPLVLKRQGTIWPVTFFYIDRRTSRKQLISTITVSEEESEAYAAPDEISNTNDESLALNFSAVDINDDCSNSDITQTPPDLCLHHEDKTANNKSNVSINTISSSSSSSINSL